MTELILASGSPRRAALLEQLGLTFEIFIPNVGESVLPLESPGDYVSRVSRAKMAAAVSALSGKSGDMVILCADTTVAVDSRILGKPGDEQTGVEMLVLLSGREHRVLTSVTISNCQRQETFIVETLVRFRDISMPESRAYWATGEPRDKAGGYGAQGAGSMFIASVNGSFSNVVGLPLCETVEGLRRFGINVLGLSAPGPAGVWI